VLGVVVVGVGATPGGLARDPRDLCAHCLTTQVLYDRWPCARVRATWVHMQVWLTVSTCRGVHSAPPRMQHVLGHGGSDISSESSTADGHGSDGGGGDDRGGNGTAGSDVKVVGAKSLTPSAASPTTLPRA
jgi:uncharacterized membrane protein YgcG